MYRKEGYFKAFASKFKKILSFLYRTKDKIPNLENVLLPMIKKQEIFFRQSQFLRDEVVANWIQQNLDDNKIIVYERGAAHAYFGVLEKVLGKKHKMIIVDEDLVGKRFKKSNLFNSENELDFPENETWLLKKIALNLLVMEEEKSLMQRESSQGAEIVNSLSREQIEAFLKQCPTFFQKSKKGRQTFHSLALEWLRSQQKSVISFPQTEPCEIAL